MSARIVSPDALKIAAAKLRKLRLETVYGFKERPAETVKSAVERGLKRADGLDDVEAMLEKGWQSLGTQEGVEFMLEAGIRFYLAALSGKGDGLPDSHKPTTDLRQTGKAA